MSPALVIRKALPGDIAEISRLHARVFGPGRFVRSAYRVRERKGHLSRFCLVAYLGAELVASLRMTEIAIGGVTGAALLGPITVEPQHRGLGRHTEVGSALLIMAIAGGAIIPYLFAALKQHYDFQLVYMALCVPCYLYILYYGARGHRLG